MLSEKQITHGSWIYNYLCNQCLSPLTLWVRSRSWWGVLDTTSCDKVCQWLATGRWLSPGTPVSSTNKTNRHDITEILLKVQLNTINNTNQITITKIRINLSINLNSLNLICQPGTPSVMSNTNEYNYGLAVSYFLEAYKPTKCLINRWNRHQEIQRMKILFNYDNLHIWPFYLHDFGMIVDEIMLT